tara:strand:+ start:912 stop:1253 length:342 start_codon:yes stop_codon:yes gene_type:complete
MVIIVIEVTNFVGAVDRARAGTDATVVNLGVEPVLIMISGAHRAHGLAGCRITVLAHHGQKIQFGIRVLAFPIALYSDPLYLSALGQLLLTYERYIVLGLAGGHTGFATSAGI